jgi:oxygen-independent coproporphyrinogen-3 oxidase
MAGIYLHIPFCRNSCNYCDFHFTTDLTRSEDIIKAMVREIHQRKEYLNEQEINTIYFGGGTPSSIKTEFINVLFRAITENFSIGRNPEITLEANPEDINPVYLKQIQKIGINRLSIGIQSFFDNDLVFMNRVHDAARAKKSITEAKNAGFKNINIDLIYGFPGLLKKNWIKNIETAISFHVEHLSAYHLTYEPSTILYFRRKKKRISEISEKKSLEQFIELCERMKSGGYIHYEISNFALDGFYSRHNSGYWKQIPYLGIGPSAHSYNGITRQWNIARNMSYIKGIERNQGFFEMDELDLKTRYHNYVMTSIRTMWGTDTGFILNEFGIQYYNHFITSATKFIYSGDLDQTGSKYYLTDKGMLISDFITKKLFI